MLEAGALISAVVALWGAYLSLQKSKDKIIKDAQDRLDRLVKEERDRADEQKEQIISHYENLIEALKTLTNAPKTQEFDKQLRSETNKTMRIGTARLNIIKRRLNEDNGF